MDTVLTILACVIGFVVAYRGFRWITTPLFKLMGVYAYYSPMMFTVPFGPRTLELHVGTSWDFFQQNNLTEQQIIHHLARGLLGLLDAADNGLVPMTMKLRGTVYYFRTDTLRRFGFRSRRMNPVETLIFLLNWLELCILHSLMKRRIALVSLSSVRVVNATIEEISARRSEIRRLVDQLERKIKPLVTV
jgi:hypothetical protein